MNEEERLFYQDVADKKSTAHGAKHRVTHGGCRLPSDFLKKKEIDKMNSDITTYPMHRPVPWEEFRRWPKDIQIAYLKGVYENYHVTNSMVAGMFRKSRQSFIQYLEYHGLLKSPYHGASKAVRERWERFCNVGSEGHPDPVGDPGPVGVPGIPVEIIDPPVADEPVPVADEPVPVAGHTPMIYPERGTVTYQGYLDDAIDALRRMFAADPKVRISVEWEVLHE